MPLLDSEKILEALCEGGDVAKRLPLYEPRQAQLDLLSLIACGFNEDKHVMAEAGTGVGKSFAYLIPAMHFALLNNAKIVISTASITLQQQLYDKDIPLVASSLSDTFGSKKIKTVIMKGRGNYLCLRRLDDALSEPPLFDFDYGELKNIYEWSKTTKTGGKAELAAVPSDPVWSNVCSESDLCLGNHCPRRENCFILSLRKEANSAHIIVVNHHLLFADLSARHSGAGYETSVILPPFNRLIIDEAHTIENAATSFFSEEFSRVGIFKQLGRLLHKRKANRHGLLVRLCAMLPSREDPLENFSDAVNKIRTAAEALDNFAQEMCGSEGIFRLSPAMDEKYLKKTLFPYFKTLRKEILSFTNIIRDITENLDDEQAVDPVVWEIKTIIRRLENIAQVCDVFCKYQKHENDVLWAEKIRASRDPWIVFSKTPLDLSPILKTSVFTPNKSVICVSATLAINGNFTYWASRSGILDDKRPPLYGCFPSPFPYSSAVLLAASTDSPLPDEENYQGFINYAACQIAAIAGGSALILFTSYQSLSSAYNACKGELTSLGIRCLKQGDDDRSRLLQDFLSDTSSCLFATDSFWEGIDAPGTTLKLVIICRLPFRTPGDPVFEARREAIQKNGGNPFMEISLPQAVMKFKQGFGRLIRSSTDTGAVIVLDSRIIKKKYGQLFIQSLPETKVSFDNFNSVLKDIENFIYK
ncbi:MAG: ATP-dependent DNA helicase DinG [Treponema sp.]|nr:ATP-dependent DNA helicase DinG [Treponema sp.]